MKALAKYRSYVLCSTRATINYSLKWQYNIQNLISMIAHLTGTVLKKSEKSIILDVNNVGYEVRGNTNLVSAVVEHHTISVFIHTRVREDEITLYGFLTSQEKELFMQLIGVSGVGPKTALEILSTPLALLTQAIFTEDTAFLSKVPGIGKKTAEKIILELKNKVKPVRIAATNVGIGETHENGQLGEVYDALENLGFNRQQISLGLKHIELLDKTTEELITAFLKNTSRA